MCITNCLLWYQWAALPIPTVLVSNMKTPESGAKVATAAPAAEETPKAALPSVAQIETYFHGLF